MSVYGGQLNLLEVEEREDIEDGYIYLERLPPKSKRGGAGINTTTAKSGPKRPAPSSKVLPNPIANKPNDQPTPVTTTSHDGPRQTYLQTAFTSICNSIAQTAMGIFRKVHEVAVKLAIAGAAVCQLTSSGVDHADNNIHGVPSHQINATHVMGRSSATDIISTNTLQLSSREEDDFIILDTAPHDPQDEDDFVMIDTSPADEDNDFIMVDTVPWAERTSRSAIHILGRSSFAWVPVRYPLV